MAELAVGQCEGLLRNDTVIAPVALQHVGVVEGAEQAVFGIGILHKVERATRACFGLGWVDAGAAKGEVELVGKVQQSVAHGLAFQASWVHAPVVRIVRIASQRGGIGMGIR